MSAFSKRCSQYPEVAISHGEGYADLYMITPEIMLLSPYTCMNEYKALRYTDRGGN
ncbi:hypothetical protein OSTOST_09910 [Ostertagia ostertagi]